VVVDESVAVDEPVVVDDSVAVDESVEPVGDVPPPPPVFVEVFEEVDSVWTSPPQSIVAPAVSAAVAANITARRTPRVTSIEPAGGAPSAAPQNGQRSPGRT
jgi:hypothetical protein